MLTFLDGVCELCARATCVASAPQVEATDALASLALNAENEATIRSLGIRFFDAMGLHMVYTPTRPRLTHTLSAGRYRTRCSPKAITHALRPRLTHTHTVHPRLTHPRHLHPRTLLFFDSLLIVALFFVFDCLIVARVSRVVQVPVLPGVPGVDDPKDVNYSASANLLRAAERVQVHAAAAATGRERALEYEEEDTLVPPDVSAFVGCLSPPWLCQVLSQMTSVGTITQKVDAADALAMLALNPENEVSGFNFFGALGPAQMVPVLPGVKPGFVPDEVDYSAFADVMHAPVRVAVHEAAAAKGRERSVEYERVDAQLYAVPILPERLDGLEQSAIDYTASADTLRAPERVAVHEAAAAKGRWRAIEYERVDSQLFAVPILPERLDGLEPGAIDYSACGDIQRSPERVAMHEAAAAKGRERAAQYELCDEWLPPPEIAAYVACLTSPVQVLKALVRSGTLSQKIEAADALAMLALNPDNDVAGFSFFSAMGPEMVTVMPGVKPGFDPREVDYSAVGDMLRTPDRVAVHEAAAAKGRERSREYEGKDGKMVAVPILPERLDGLEPNSIDYSAVGDILRAPDRIAVHEAAVTTARERSAQYESADAHRVAVPILPERLDGLAPNSVDYSAVGELLRTPDRIAVHEAAAGRGRERAAQYEMADAQRGDALLPAVPVVMPRRPAAFDAREVDFSPVGDVLRAPERVAVHEAAAAKGRERATEYERVDELLPVPEISAYVACLSPPWLSQVLSSLMRKGTIRQRIDAADALSQLALNPENEVVGFNFFRALAPEMVTVMPGVKPGFVPSEVDYASASANILYAPERVAVHEAAAARGREISVQYEKRDSQLHAVPILPERLDGLEPSDIDYSATADILRAPDRVAVHEAAASRGRQRAAEYERADALLPPPVPEPPPAKPPPPAATAAPPVPPPWLPSPSLPAPGLPPPSRPSLPPPSQPSSLPPPSRPALPPPSGPALPPPLPAPPEATTTTTPAATVAAASAVATAEPTATAAVVAAPEAPLRYRRRGYSGSNTISEGEWRALPPKDRKKYVKVKEDDAELESLFSLVTQGKISDAPTLLKLLDDLDRNVRVAALQALSKTLGSEGLEVNAGAIVARIGDHEEPVREAALEVLRTLDRAVLSEHTEALLGMQNEAEDEAVRDAAARCLDLMTPEPAPVEMEDVLPQVVRDPRAPAPVLEVPMMAAAAPSAAAAAAAPLSVATLPPPAPIEVSLNVNSSGSFGLTIISQGGAGGPVVVSAMDPGSTNHGVIAIGDEIVEVAGVVCQNERKLCLKTLGASKAQPPVVCMVVRRADEASSARNQHTPSPAPTPAESTEPLSDQASGGRSLPAGPGQPLPPPNQVSAPVPVQEAEEPLLSQITQGKISDTPTLLTSLADVDPSTRIAALRALSSTLGSTGLEPHAGTIVTVIKDHEEPVRDAALEVLRTLDETVLAKHVKAIFDILDNEEEGDGARDAAGRCLDLMDQALVEAALVDAYAAEME